jgi:hypothetical protein
MNDAEFAVAMALHQAGRTGEAAALYRTILGSDRTMRTACICWA